MANPCCFPWRSEMAWSAVKGIFRYPLTPAMILVWDGAVHMCLKEQLLLGICAVHVMLKFIKTFCSLLLMTCSINIIYLFNLLIYISLINLIQTLEERAKQLRTGQVFFYRPDDVDNAPQPIQDVEALGYHIVATHTRILLRSAYSSLLSYTIKVWINNSCPAICAFTRTSFWISRFYR